MKVHDTDSFWLGIVLLSIALGYITSAGWGWLAFALALILSSFADRKD